MTQNPEPMSPPPEVINPAPSGVASPALTGGGVLPKKHGNGFQDLTGRRFGRWTIISLHSVAPNRNTRWNAQCDCGTCKPVSGSNLRSGGTLSCGCFRREQAHKAKFQNLTGQRFGRLVVLSLHSAGPGLFTRWNVQCDCGALRTVCANSIKAGRTTSCGCFCKEQTRKAHLNLNLTDEERIRARKDRYGNESWIKFSQRIMARDNYVCLACGERNGHHAAHHIFPWAKHPGLRYDEANLVTLCKECHKQFHALYGNDCDLDDLEEYLKETKEPNDETKNKKPAECHGFHPDW